MATTTALTTSSDHDHMNNNNDNDDNGHMLSLSQIDHALEQCGDEIDALYLSLDVAFERHGRLKQERERQELRLEQEQEELSQKEQAAAQQRQHEEKEALRQREQDAVLEQQRQQQEQQKQQKQQQQSQEIMTKEARIAELRRQIQEVEDATKAATTAATNTSAARPTATGNVAKRVERERQHETHALTAPSTPTADPSKKKNLTAPSTPTADPSKKKNSMWKSPFRKSKSPAATSPSPPLSSSSSPRSTASATALDAATTKTTEHTNIQADAMCKQKHQWEKPAWALPSDAVQEDADILTAPIQNGLHANQGNGYSRRVFAKDIHKIEGNFIAPTKDAPPSRLAWIVVNLDGDKVGKIVMHLEEDTSNNENVDRLVGQFLDLKGLAMERTKDGNLVLKDFNPQLVVTTKKSPKRRGKTNNVIGEVQEGQDVLETVLKAGADSIVTIKQAHIYPVKKARGMFA
jgi:chemotaxis protein histidine kinase CheA